MAGNQDPVKEAFQILSNVKDFAFPGRQQYLHPYVMLSALLTHAPTLSGKTEVARDIIEGTRADLTGGLVALTDYFWTSLLVPRIDPHYFHQLISAVRSQGGKTPTPSEHPSRRAESLEYRAAAGRLNQGEKMRLSAKYCGDKRLFDAVGFVVLSADSMTV